MTYQGHHLLRTKVFCKYLSVRAQSGRGREVCSNPNIKVEKQKNRVFCLRVFVLSSRWLFRFFSTESSVLKCCVQSRYSLRFKEYAKTVCMCFPPALCRSSIMGVIDIFNKNRTQKGVALEPVVCNFVPHQKCTCSITRELLVCSACKEAR